MDAKKFQEKLMAICACEEGRVFCEGKSLSDAWRECERPDWMLWLYRRASNYEKRNSVMIAIFAAEQVIGIFEKKYPNDLRPRKAIETAKNYLETTCPESRKAAAAYASSAAAAAAAAARQGLKKKICAYIREVVPVVEFGDDK